MNALKKSIEINKSLVEAWINEYIIDLKHNSPKKIVDAMEYSLNAGGKRLRPVLMIETFKLFSPNIEKTKGFVVALEAIHTYSLIHDDLPAMDNDDFRRGKPTNHKIFGEAIAILAGDALLNFAMETLINEIKDEKTLAASRIISNSSGTSGMIGGQVIDIESENQSISYEVLKELHAKKTGKLISAAVLAGGILGGADENSLENLRDYAEEIGLAFQITDDILDVIGDEQELGKPVGSDVDNNKVTYVSLFGLEKAKILAKESIDRALEAIANLEKNQFFIEFAKYILIRKS